MCTAARKASTSDEHRAIVTALKKRDAEAAAAAMEAHLDAVMTELIGVAERNPDAIALPAGATAAA
jgi:DNA-binding GntR family transcriptional regulator